MRLSIVFGAIGFGLIGALLKWRVFTNAPWWFVFVGMIVGAFVGFLSEDGKKPKAIDPMCDWDQDE